MNKMMCYATTCSGWPASTVTPLEGGVLVSNTITVVVAEGLPILFGLDCGFFRRSVTKSGGYER